MGQAAAPGYVWTLLCLVDWHRRHELSCLGCVKAYNTKDTYLYNIFIHNLALSTFLQVRQMTHANFALLAELIGMVSNHVMVSWPIDRVEDGGLHRGWRYTMHSPPRSSFPPASTY